MLVLLSWWARVQLISDVIEGELLIIVVSTGVSNSSTTDYYKARGQMWVDVRPFQMFRIKSRVVCSERAFIEKQLCLIGSTRLQFRTSVSLGDPLKGQMPGQDRTGPQQTRLYQFREEEEKRRRITVVRYVEIILIWICKRIKGTTVLVILITSCKSTDLLGVEDIEGRCWNKLQFLVMKEKECKWM